VIHHDHVAVDVLQLATLPGQSKLTIAAVASRAKPSNSFRSSTAYCCQYNHFVRHGGLEGRVVSMAADADTDRSGQHYFRVVIETTDSTLGPDGSLTIIPVIQAKIYIHTSEKRVLDYLIQPVLKTCSEAFRER
jgi:hypothetical protein